MDLEFKLHKLKQASDVAKKYFNGKECEVIVAGTEKIGDNDYLKVAEIKDEKICLVGGLMLDDAVFLVKENDLIPTEIYTTFDIPKKYLTVDIIDNVKRLNE